MDCNDLENQMLEKHKLKAKLEKHKLKAKLEKHKLKAKEVQIVKKKFHQLVKKKMNTQKMSEE
jgi:hypothetical protein